MIPISIGMRVKTLFVEVLHIYQLLKSRIVARLPFFFREYHEGEEKTEWDMWHMYKTPDYEVTIQKVGFEKSATQKWESKRKTPLGQPSPITIMCFLHLQDGMALINHVMNQMFVHSTLKS